MDAYSYLHNLRMLDEATINERSGLPNLAYTDKQLHLPFAHGINPCISKKVRSIILEMSTGIKEFQKSHPFLFHISEVKEETEQSTKIRKIFIWAGAKDLEGSVGKLIGLYQRPQNVHQSCKKFSGFALTEQLAKRNMTLWNKLQSKCQIDDFFKVLNEPKIASTPKNRILHAFYVAASIPNGIASYHRFKSFLSGMNKTTLLSFLIYKNGANLCNAANPDRLLTDFEKTSEGRKKLGELFTFSDELISLNPYKDPTIDEKKYAGLASNTRVDFEKRVIGWIQADEFSNCFPPNWFPSEAFFAYLSFADIRPREFIYRSCTGKLNRSTLIESPIQYSDKWWQLIADKKAKIEDRAQRSSHLFNDFNNSLMKKAEEMGYLIPHMTEGKEFLFSNGTKLLIYFLSFLKEEHKSLEVSFSYSDDEVQEFTKNPNKFFRISTWEDKCILIGLWIKNILESDRPLAKMQLESLIVSGTILIRVFQERGENARLLSEPLEIQSLELHLLKPITETNAEEVDQRMNDYLASAIDKELRALTNKMKDTK